MHYEENNLVAALIAMTFLTQLIYAEAGVNGYVIYPSRNPASGAVITIQDLNNAVAAVACMGASDFFQTPHCQEHIL